MRIKHLNPPSEAAPPAATVCNGLPSLSTSGETLTIEESMNLEGENGDRWDVGVGDEYEWSRG